MPDASKMSFYRAANHVHKNFSGYVGTACKATIPAGTLPVFGVVANSCLDDIHSWPNREYAWDWTALLEKLASLDGVFEFAVYNDTTLCGLVVAVANHDAELPGGGKKKSWLKVYAIEVMQDNPLGAAAHKWLHWALTYYGAACGIENVEFQDPKRRGWRINGAAMGHIYKPEIKKKPLMGL